MSASGALSPEPRSWPGFGSVARERPISDTVGKGGAVAGVLDRAALRGAEHERGQRNEMTRYVFDFSEGNASQRDLLGGKGANLAEMTNLGLPVPPGFTITTDACRVYLESGDVPPELSDEVDTHLASLEEAMGRTL